jgi:hypothetical protein
MTCSPVGYTWPPIQWDQEVSLGGWSGHDKKVTTLIVCWDSYQWLRLQFQCKPIWHAWGKVPFLLTGCWGNNFITICQLNLKNCYSLMMSELFHICGFHILVVPVKRLQFRNVPEKSSNLGTPFYSCVLTEWHFIYAVLNSTPISSLMVAWL